MTTTEETKPLTHKQLVEAQLEREAREHLIELFAGDDKPNIRTVLRHVSSSGMNRDISVFYAKDNQILNITYSVAKAIGWPLVERNGSRAIKVGGCGMDMGFHLVYTLSSVLYRGTIESDPGYYLNQAWL
jgi:hypothetical protein